MTENQSSIPSFLVNQTDFISHLQTLMDGLKPNEIGERFARFAQHLIPYTDIGKNFNSLEKRQVSHDGGVDLESRSRDDKEILFVQVKFTIKGVDDIDAIISKFAEFDKKRRLVRLNNLQEQLFQEQNKDEELLHANYLIFTSSPINSLILKYARSERPSRQFYERLNSENLLSILDRESLYSTLLNTYKRTHLLPENVQIKFIKPFINLEGVYIGIINAQELKNLYNNFGDALFLENIREWLGPASGRVQKTDPRRETPNQAIARTLNDSPERFLARNNGITMRASKIDLVNNQEVILGQASIVNGCQTTMAIIKASSISANALVKIVETNDSWDIAQAANFQNEINRISLELARDLRPQLVRQEATKAGFKFDSEFDHKTAFSVMEELYEESVVYEEFNLFFIGLFSRSPKNVFDNNYTELRQDLLTSLHEDSEKGDAYEDLFKIHLNARKFGLQSPQNLISRGELAELFQRFWKDEKRTYRTYLTLLTIMRITNNFQFKKAVEDYSRLRTLIRKSREIVENKPDEFFTAYILAFKAVAVQVMGKHQDRKDQLQSMYTEISNSNFDNLLDQMDLIAS